MVLNIYRFPKKRKLKDEILNFNVSESIGFLSGKKMLESMGLP